MLKSYLKDFRLVGGTALSLQIGHRISYDLDLFTQVPFEGKELKLQLMDDFNSIHAKMESANTLLCTINDIKVDFIRFRYEFSYPLVLENEIRLANINDIAPMKLDAISGRGRKRDFYDLYLLLRRFSLEEILNLYKAKYKHTSYFHVIKSINYFEEAEEEADPITFDKTLTWAKVKKTIIKEVQKL
ncbi:MAG: nucleotidyl transferase AbiEii/AbiGii toxin family protein [Bacteroidetes bacterium]|nr:nucleotidyl transferase AbiEii/AbiGii toxin family protein [Bacteroidota bacterium]